MKKEKEKKQDEVCQNCEKAPAEEPHSCPYSEEINDDYEKQCNCCKQCRHECLMDI